MEQAADRDAGRLQKAAKDRPTILAQTAFLGSIALMFIVPVIGGAYLGRWMDGLFEGYSVRWTVSLILLGIGIGIVNIWLFIRERS
ncbi:AtpZ/AtpI family protein [Paremcibacter congregatus]|uniref:AtpZ/AtpI family protein n=1 Tax=Paremcibacter congregatus TaxID=2043170 RepID=UPI0030EB9C1E